MAQPIPILMYHSVDTNCAPAYRRWAVSPNRFAQQMAALKKLNCAPLTITDFVRRARANELPPRSVAITFDDGMRDFALHALPVLRQFKFPSTLFVATGYVGETARWLAPLGEGNRAMLDWAELSALGQFDVELGAHTHTHPQLDLLPPEEAEREIALSQKLLRKHTGQKIGSMAYPHGYSTAEIRRRVVNMGFSAACRVADALSTPEEDVFALSRIIVTEETSEFDIARYVRGHAMSITPPIESWKILAWRQYRQWQRTYFRTIGRAT